MTMQLRPARFSAVIPTRQVAPLVKNVGHLLSDYAYGKVHNITKFKDNAFILSSLIQVCSRIFVANKSARETQNKPEGPYRYIEAVKTTFREALGFCLSYLVLRQFQRFSVDFFRNMLFVSKGLPTKPTILNGVFAKMFGAKGITTQVITKGAATETFPGLWQTMKQIGGEIRAFVTNAQKPLDKEKMTRLIAGQFPDVVEAVGVTMHTNGLKNYKRLEGLVEFINKNLASKEKRNLLKELARSGASEEIIRGHKLQTFFDWVPALMGSIPSMIMSGLMLERFCQKHAEGMAQRIARFLGKKTGTPPVNAHPEFSSLSSSQPALEAPAMTPLALAHQVPVGPTLQTAAFGGTVGLPLASASPVFYANVPRPQFYPTGWQQNGTLPPAANPQNWRY